jgi:hypothetical protein
VRLSSAVAVFQADDVVELGGAHLQDHRVLQRLDAVHVARADGDALAGLHLEVHPVEVVEEAARLEEHRLLLALVLLQGQGVALGDLQHLAGVALLVGVPDLAAPGLGDDLGAETAEGREPII